jgi:tetratricopeptide (TPR) repeat protein
VDREALDAAVMRAAVQRDPALPGLLVERAAERIAAGELADAAADLQSAADLDRDARLPLDESRVRQALSTVQRSLGMFEEAELNVRRARELAPDKTPFAVSAATELGEVLLLSGRPRQAVGAYRDALSHGASIGIIPVAQAALYRRIAIAFALAGDHADAAIAAEQAADLYARAGYAGAATRSRIEEATALVEAGLASAATRAIADARAAAPSDHGAQAELDLLESARAVIDRDYARARSLAVRARQQALDGNALLPYVAAALAIAELDDRAGDRLGAYASLAVGWVTAGDKIGNDLAGSIFRAPLEALRTRWGQAEFDAVKADYYARRQRS